MKLRRYDGNDSNSDVDNDVDRDEDENDVDAGAAPDLLAVARALYFSSIFFSFR